MLHLGAAPVEIALAFIPLMPKAKLSPTAIRNHLATKWPDLGQPEATGGERDQISFRVAGCDVIIAMMRAPIPWSDLEGPCATSWLWKDAAATLKQHAGHLIVTLLSDLNPVERSVLLTQVCAAVLATCAEAPGVYWSNATLVVPSKVFQEFAERILPDPPLYIWVDYRVGTTGKTSSGFTTGMQALGHMELETESATEAPGDLRERFFALGNYLLEHGPVIKNGDTVGEDANERIKVVYAKSAFGHEGQVMRLEYEPLQKKKGWLGR
jgi:hypothetical protein